jgi:hypothetical protein
MTTLGHIAYDAYFKACGGKSLISGAPLPSWDGQADTIKAAWEAAGSAAGNAAMEERAAVNRAWPEPPSRVMEMGDG